MAETVYYHYGQLHKAAQELLRQAESRLIVDTIKNETLPIQGYVTDFVKAFEEYGDEQGIDLNSEMSNDLADAFGNLELAVLSLLEPENNQSPETFRQLPDNIKNFVVQSKDTYKRRLEEDKAVYGSKAKDAAIKLLGLFQAGEELMFTLPAITFYSYGMGYDRKEERLSFFKCKPLNTDYFIGREIGRWLYLKINPAIYQEMEDAVGNILRSRLNPWDTADFTQGAAGKYKNLIEFVSSYCGLVYSNGQEDKHEFEYPHLEAARKMYRKMPPEDFNGITKLPPQEACARIKELTGIDISPSML